MTRPLLTIIIIFFLISCKTKVETKQWNLIQTIGWKVENPDDFAVLFIKTNPLPNKADQIADKRKLDEAILQELRKHHIGDQAENDDTSETDFHFVVAKDYEKAIAAILSVAKTFKAEERISVYKRDYQLNDKWTDQVVYPK